MVKREFDKYYHALDIRFWKNKGDLTGLSVKGILLNSLFQVIIMFYLLDNESSLLVIGSVAIGALIELWKIKRVIQVSWTKVASFLWYPKFGTSDSYAKSKTKEYDERAMKYLCLASVPLMIAYSVWSLKYELHKSWYSWVLRSLVGFVYTFGFIAMTPQLFINYKLKSVAHMPWKVLVYKTLNTVIDDLFAFAIKMPWMHRIACLRDGNGIEEIIFFSFLDLVFWVLLYQMWIYPVDKKRANEYNQATLKKDAKGGKKND